MMTRTTFTFAALLCSVMGCSPALKETTDQKKPSPKLIEPSLPSDVFGKWKVVRHFEPGISAMDKTQADAWVGRDALFERTNATFGTQTCADANYAVTVVDADQYLLEEFHIEAKSIEIEHGKVPIVYVTCGGSDWIAPGGLLVVKSKERILTIWNGVFFELAR
jgi:hypothetical protein